MHQMAIVIGYLFIQLMAISMGYNWRILYLINLIPCLLQLTIFATYCPESPKYLMISGDRLMAERELRSLWNDESDDLEIMECDQLQPNQQQGLTLSELIRSPFARQSLLVACFLHLAQQLSGINGVFCYAGELFKGIWWIPLSLAVLNVLMTILAIWLMESAGRRSLLFASVIGCLVCLSITTLGSLLGFSILECAGVLGFVACFAVGLGPVPWLMIGEVFPGEAVAGAVSLAVSVNWTINFIVTAIFPVLASSLGSFTFVPFIAILVPFALYVQKYLPETRGRPADYI